MIMKAVHLMQAGRLEVTDVKITTRTPLLAVSACGICRTDRKAAAALPRGMELPIILGHEVVGKLLLDLPDSGLRAGDQVVAWPAINCGKCRFCQAGRENLCPLIQLFGYHLDGGFAEKVWLPSVHMPFVRVLKIPHGLSVANATFCEPLACVINAFSKITGTEAKRCLIVGAGLIGRLAARVAALSGMEVQFYESDRKRLDLAMGDGRVFDSNKADVVFIAASGEGAVCFGMDNLAPGGTILLFSGQRGEYRLEIAHNQIHQQEFSIIGVYGCRFDDVRKALAMLAGRQVAVDDLLSRKISLDELPQELCRPTAFDEYKIVMVNE